MIIMALAVIGFVLLIYGVLAEIMWVVVIAAVLLLTGAFMHYRSDMPHRPEKHAGR